MQGMMTQAQEQPAPQGAPQGQPPQQGQPQQPPQEQTTADTQEAYDVATGQMLSFVYDERGIQALTKIMKATDDPAQGMARLFGRLLMSTVQSAVMAGKRVAPQLIFQAGIEVIRAMSEVAQSQGILTKDNEKQVAEQAFYDGIALFGNEAKDEALTPDERQQYVKLLEAAEQMEQKAGGLPQGEQPGGQQQPRNPEGEA